MSLESLAQELGISRQSAARLLSVRNRTPVGTTVGLWTTISEVYYKWSRSGKASSYALCQCACGSPPKEVCVAEVKYGRPKSCGCLQKRVGKYSPNWLGDDHPRRPDWYRKRLVELQGGECRWCGKPLNEGKPYKDGKSFIHVDHAHGRCDHDERFCCPWCLRGAVHAECNKRDIMAAERVRDKNYALLVPRVGAYLDSRICLDTGEVVPWAKAERSVVDAS